jgi:uracil-DNA glycosylase
MNYFSRLNQEKNLEQSYDVLLPKMNACTLCNLHKTRNKVVPGAGSVPCDLMLIGEGPGAQEDAQGLPFIGRAGKLLTQILQTINIERETDIFITNIVKCRPPENRDPEKDEKEGCSNYLINQLNIIKPKILLLVGSPSLKTVLDDKLTITRARGAWFLKDVPYMAAPLHVMPIFHPSYLLRYASKEKGSPKWLTLQDMKTVKVKMDELGI